MRQLLTPLASAQSTKRAIVQSGLNSKRISDWADLNLIHLLNQKPNRTSKKIVEIVETCHLVIQLDQQLRTLTASRGNESLSKELIKLVERLHASFLEYTCVPVVRYLPTMDGCLSVEYSLAGPSRRAQEMQAVAWILDHIHAMHRIRRCRRASCARWFFAVTDHQKYCGDDCRKRDAQQGEAFKERRRRYMKKYREGEVQRDQTAKRLARRKSK